MTVPAPESQPDPGVQVQRTVLAWHRTFLAATAPMVLLIRTSMTQPDWYKVLSGAAVGSALCAAIWLEWAARRRPRPPLLMEHGAGRPTGRAGALPLAVLAAGSVTLACLGLVQAVARVVA